MATWQQLFHNAAQSPRLFLGLMSGTSGDGVDAALVRLDDTGESRAELLAFTFIPFSPALRKNVLGVSHGNGNAEVLSRLSVALAEEYARAVEAVCKEAGISNRTTICAIGCHGQTVSHSPHGDFPATLQIGDAATLATRTGIPVVSQFRAADVALGGQGAPLVPYADWRLLTHSTRTRALQNIGGIGNVTFLPAGGSASEVLGFDTGPGNMLIDLAAQWATQGEQQFDAEGKIAAQGKLLPELLEWLAQHPFLTKTPPKSAGREEFGKAFWNTLLERAQTTSVAVSVDNKREWLFSPTEGRNYYEPVPADIVATVTAFTAYSIAESYLNFLPALPDEVIVSGGGAKNPVLMQYLAQKLHPIPVHTSQDLGINVDAREAIAFAVLADATLRGEPASLPAVTGASRAAVLGSVTLPR